MASKENQEALKHIANVLKTFEENADVDFIRKTENLTTLEDFTILQQAIDDLELYKKALDKACEILNRRCQYVKPNDEKAFNGEYKEKEDWKEYLLKESEKENGQ